MCCYVSHTRDLSGADKLGTVWCDAMNSLKPMVVQHELYWQQRSSCIYCSRFHVYVCLIELLYMKVQSAVASNCFQRRRIDSAELIRTRISQHQQPVEPLRFSI